MSPPATSPSRAARPTPRIGRVVIAAALAATWLAAVGARAQTSPPGERAAPRPIALYDFASAVGSTVVDRSGVGAAVDLRIRDPGAVSRSAGSLELHGATVIESDRPATKITTAIRRSGEIAVEAWLRPATADQRGPARIVTLSENATERSFTLGQDGDRFDVRLRTDRTSANGIPSLRSTAGSLRARPVHVIYSRDSAGVARIWVDGEPRGRRTVAGRTAGWDASFRLALANELTGGRPWLGTYDRVAIFDRALSDDEVARRFAAGPDAAAPPADDPAAALARRFETRVAPLLARRCLECHDAANSKGRLDLSRRATAFTTRKRGPTILPGQPTESLLWQQVASDEMPKKRARLSADEKALLRDWIASGATWSLDAIDPAVYEHRAQATATVARRLTVDEYIETVRAAVGVDIGADARRLLPRDLRADGFDNTAYNLGVDLAHVEAYARLARLAVGRMDVVEFAGRFSRSRKLTDKDMRALIAKLGRWVLRGPLDEHEIVSFRGITTTVASSGGGFADAVRYLLEAMLQAPRFLYRIERQRGGGRPVGAYELASRLSSMLGGGPPDRELMRAADAGELGDRDRAAAQVRRMLGDPRAVRQSLRFAAQWLDLDRLADLEPDAERFPTWSAELAADMRAETLAFFEEVAWKRRLPLERLFDAQVTFATPRLARHYGLEPIGAAGERHRYDLASVPERGGLLTQGAVLTVGGDDASMVTRGLFVLHDILRGTVSDPPPCVDTTPPPTRPGRTQRGIAEARIADRSCGGCHARFEPLAFGLEKLDGVGAHHEVDRHGNRLRDDGEILFPGTGEPVAYGSAAELMDLLAASDRVRECLTWKLAQFALGRPLGSADARQVAAIRAAAWRDGGGGTYADLMAAIAASDLVRRSRAETDR